MIQIGLTGGIGAGKSMVASVIEKMGYPVFYSDQEAKQLYVNQPILKEQLIGLVGKELYENGQFQKNILAQQLFENPLLKEKVSALVHPLVRSRFNSWALQQTSNLVFNEAAILFETGAYKHFTATILVIAPEELRIQRVVARDALGPQAVRKRIAQQWTDAQKIALTPYVIENDGRPLLCQIEACLQAIQKEFFEAH